MKKSLWILSALALAGFCMTGCLEGAGPVDGEQVDNDEYCDGQCGDSEYCLYSSDLESGECSACPVDCALENSLYPVCIVLDGGVGPVCVATANCPDGQGYAKDESGHYVCSNGDPIDDPAPEAGAGQFIRVDDVSTFEEACGKFENGKCSKDDPGADLDAIVVRKADGGYLYAKEIMAYSRGAEKDRVTERGVSGDPTAVLGKPDSLISYPDSGDCYYLQKDSNKDDYKFTFMSLGGEGGYVEVKMDDVFHAGDTVDIIELGNCELVNTHSGQGVSKSKVGAESMKVQVSISGEDGSWKVLGSAGKATGGIFTAGKITSDMLK
ncbi:MAG: hypothetical protein IJ165_15575 [Proteobacteria bacterium]|nr:hypothetical protein [Pseudomonadota bacterium]